MKKKPFERVLIANRGEIALRIQRALHTLELESVAVYSDADVQSLHVRQADDAVRLGGVRAEETYLSIPKIVQAAVQSRCAAVHPGYGFLAENAAFAEAVQAAGLIWIGPRPEVMRSMGDKAAARALAEQAGVPVVPGTDASADEKVLVADAQRLGFPLMIKAVAGGSGRGMRIVRQPDSFASLLAEAMAEAQAAFANPAVILERYIEHPRHIEVQVFGDGRGNVLHFGERECSVQRRNQKLIEEARAPRLHQSLRERMYSAACSLAASVQYEGAGTIEFLVSGGEHAEDPFFFLEMNTRIQVEHPVTEEVCGVDLLVEQLRLARGEPLRLRQDEIEFSGHAIEFRIYAEDPQRDFAPSFGLLKYCSRVGGPGLREDSWIEAGMKISPYYDALLAKLIVYGRDRQQAIARARAALDEYCIEGVPTTLGFHRWLLRQQDFIDAQIDTAWIAREYRGQQRAGLRLGPLELPEPLPPQKVV